MASPHPEAAVPHRDRIVDPQKKKQSLQHDRRNAYGENDKSSRKAIHFRKRWVNQTYRHAVKQALGSPDSEEAQDQVSQVQRIHWKKVPDMPLGDALGEGLLREIGALLFAERSNLSLLPQLERRLAADGWVPQAVQAVMKQLRSVAIEGYWSLDPGLSLAKLRELLAALNELRSRRGAEDA